MIWIIEKIKNFINPQSEPVGIEYLLVDKLPERGEQWAIYICGTEWYFFRNDEWVRADFDDDESLVWIHDFDVGGRPKGKWENHRCNVCNYLPYAEGEMYFNYCPYCGAYMGADMRETETWQTSKGNVEMPKGLFDKIYEDGEE